LAPKEKIAAVVLAAGRSVRFRSAHSKLTHPLGGRPLIQWPLAVLRRLEVDPIVVVVGFQAEAVEALCGPDVLFAYQREPHGTGHAVLTTASILEGFEGEILILNGDVPLVRADTLRRLMETHRRSRSDLTLATALLDDPRGWGRIVREGGAVRRIVEERDTSAEERRLREVNVGLYCVAPRVLFPLLEQIRPDNVQGELYLTDMVGLALESNLAVTDVRVDAVEVAQVNSRGELATMEKTLRMRINSTWMDAGVTLEDPDTTYIEPGVMIGRDTVIGPNVQLKGRTVIGEGCRLDGTALLVDAKLGSGVYVKFGVVISEAEIGDRCQIGPFAQLRPGTQLAEEVHIGDFVETKKAVLGARSKANHLAYLGDTRIGRDTNVGAGTITCNYDGFRKHVTVIGDRVQVGSDTQLVAPVTVGDDAYIGTGTTVRKDVPAGALAFNRKEDLHRPGWVAQWRARQAGDGAVERPTSPPNPPLVRGEEKKRVRKKTSPRKKSATAATKSRRAVRPSKRIARRGARGKQ